jgi:hypothetical protein
MFDVCIAVARKLHSKREYSFNETSILPLGDDVAIIHQRLNDDVLSTESKAARIKDSKVRNDQYFEQEVAINSRSLVGKKSNLLNTITCDISIMKKFNNKLIAAASQLDINAEKLKNVNFVSFPFTTAEKLDVNNV